MAHLTSEADALPLDFDRRLWPLLFILAIAFLLRVLDAVFFTGAIEIEGAEYARIAQNLLSGNGYVGIATEGTQLFFPPLVPLAIAGISLVTKDAEIAGRILSVAIGALIVLPTYSIALRMYDRRTALIAAMFVACHPFLVQISTTVQSEPIYLTLLLTAFCFTFATMETPTPRNLFSSGAMYGLAYLARHEAVAPMLISAGLIFLNMFVRRRAGAFLTSARVGLMIGAFMLVATPYIEWLSAQSGQFRIQGKSPLNMATESRIQLGENPLYAQFGVDAGGDDRGVWNQPNIVIFQTDSLKFKDVATYILSKSKMVANKASEALASNFSFGSPALFALAILGLFARPWSPSLAIYQLQLLSGLGLLIFATYFTETTGLGTARYYVLLIPLYCIWASIGLQKMALWGKTTASAMGFHHRYRSGASMLMWTLGIGLVFILSMLAAIGGLSGARSERPIKIAGEWLRATSTEPIRLLASSTPISFHAKAAHFWLPYCDEKTALLYIERKNINIVVVRKSDDSRPYSKSWAENGIPDPRAKLIYAADIGTRDKVMVYQIKR
jgi:4-amino-4-deoxy-L-arabinose transferase-like glycosyltransferase